MKSIKQMLCLVLLNVPITLCAQNYVDPVAVQILDRMSDVIGELTSCSYRLNTSVDGINRGYQYGQTTDFGSHEVFMVGPDKMLVNSWGVIGHSGYWYNGDSVTYYSYKENNYGVIDAPDNIISTIDSLHEYYEFDFPAADFFYPTFTDDVLEEFDTLVFLGTKVVHGKSCFHLLADNPNMTYQIWIANDALNLPLQFSIIYKDQQPSSRYQATFTDWDINPDLPLSIFDFLPPNGAHLITIPPKP